MIGVEVRLRVEGVGNTSITYAWDISSGGDIHVSGRRTVEYVDDRGADVGP